MNHHHDPQLLWKQEVSPSVRKSRRRRRRRNHKVEPTGREKMIGAAVLIASGIYVCFLWKVQTFLDKLEAGENFRMEALLRKAIERSSWRMSGRNNSTEGGLRLKDEIRGARGRREDQRFHAVKEEDTDAMDVADSRKKRTGRPKRYILFQGFMSGQGTGNVINGLLAAHLLAKEFDRIVCVGDGFHDFHVGFEPVQPLEECPAIAQKWKYETSNKDIVIKLNNFGIVPDECRLHRLLSSDTEVLIIRGNTYPRWPAVPENFFFTYYRAKKELIDMLPYDPVNPPKTVVHLRAPDSASDHRKGLDDATFRALGEALPLDTYLITNQVQWFDQFEEKYHWRHPDWESVKHSAFIHRKAWDVRKRTKEKKEIHARDASTLQILQLWADWHTLLTADSIFHTHSDFSVSAIHWQGIASKSIEGYDKKTGKLKLVDESWRVDPETPPLVDRRLHGEGTSEMRACHGTEIDYQLAKGKASR